MNTALLCARAAACYLQTSKLGRSTYRDVVEQCDSALSINPASIKALYRKGVALYHIRRYSHAIDVLTQASQLPDSSRDHIGRCDIAYVNTVDIRLTTVLRSISSGK